MLLAPPQERIWTPPVKALKKDILMDMARRAQPVIYEVEARKQWSTQNASSSAQGGGLLTMPSGRGLLQRGVIGGRDAPDNLLGTLVGGQKRDRLPEGAGSVEGAPLNSNNSEKGGSVSEAIRISKLGSFQRKVALFRNRFFAATSARSRACKRSEVIKLAKAVKGTGSILPLSRELVESRSRA
jgi:hypothetical protein